jgi:anti-sigma factor RsiW
MSDPRDRWCDPEAVFEFADGELGPERAREVRAHLEECPECRELHEKELDLNAFLGSLEFSELRLRSVSRGVAMALPTRPAKARLLWALLAAALLVVALLALDLSGESPVTLIASAMGWFSIVAGWWEVIQTMLAAGGSAIAVALAVGALLDLVVAAAYLLTSRRRPREA